MEETVERSYCQTMNERNKVISILALAEKAGMSTGFVSTARATHATPAQLLHFTWALQAAKAGKQGKITVAAMN